MSHLKVAVLLEFSDHLGDERVILEVHVDGAEPSGKVPLPVEVVNSGGQALVEVAQVAQRPRKKPGSNLAGSVQHCIQHKDIAIQ